MQAAAQATVQTTTETEAITALVPQAANDDSLGAASEVVTEPATFKTVEELTAHCSIGFYTSGICYRSHYNVRPAPADIKADVRQLAHLIAHQGLLQNLIGYLDGEGKVAIVAGERRRNAILLCIEEGWLPEDFQIPVLLITEAEATAISLAENSGRKEMHHAEISAAVLEMHNNGASVPDIAVTFGLEEIVVKRRLKLASLSPKIFDMYRNDALNFDQVAAYALVDDHAKQEAAFQALGKHANGFQIKNMLTNGKVSASDDRVAKFVGLENFKAAGGAVVHDLFSATGNGYIEDLALLDSLAATQLQPTIDALNTEGFAWVKVVLRPTYNEFQDFIAARRIQRKLTEEEAGQLAAIETEMESIQNKLAAMEESGDDESPEYDELEQKLDQLDDQKTGLGAKAQIIIPEDAPLAGAIVSLTQSGYIEVHRGLIDPADKKKIQKLAPEAAAKAGVAASPVKERAVHSEALTHALTTHRTMALRAELMDRPDVAIVLATHALMTEMLRKSRMGGFDKHTLSSLSWERDSLDDAACEGKAGKAVEARRKELLALLPKNVTGEKLLAWLLEQEQATVWKMFAFCTALSFDATGRREDQVSKDKRFATVAKVLELDMANWWNDYADYFGRVATSRITEVVGTVSGDAPAALAKMKKADAVKYASAKMEGTRWLPEMLRS